MSPFSIHIVFVQQKIWGNGVCPLINSILYTLDTAYVEN